MALVAMLAMVSASSGCSDDGVDYSVTIVAKTTLSCIEKSPHFDSSNSFRLDLLSEMAVSLGYKNLKQTEIDRFYSPKYFGSQMSRQEILFQENLRILTRSKSCAESFTDEEYEQHYKELMEQQGE